MCLASGLGVNELGLLSDERPPCWLKYSYRGLCYSSSVGQAFLKGGKIIIKKQTVTKALRVSSVLLGCSESCGL